MDFTPSGSPSAWEAIGWLEGTFKLLHSRGDLTDYGYGTAARYLQSLRSALKLSAALGG